MKRYQLTLAAKLWSLAMIAHVDPDFLDSNGDEAKVAKNAKKRARTALYRLGSEPAEIISAQDAIDKAKELRP